MQDRAVFETAFLSNAHLPLLKNPQAPVSFSLGIYMNFFCSYIYFFFLSWILYIGYEYLNFPLTFSYLFFPPFLSSFFLPPLFTIAIM